MNTTVVYSLDYRSPKKDGTFPLLMRITHKTVLSQMAMGYSFHEKDFDEKKRIVKSSYQGTESVTRLNNYLRKKLVIAVDIITKLDEAKKLDALTSIEIRDLIKNSSQTTSFFGFMQSIIDEKAANKKIGTARIYKDVMSILKKFTNQKDLSFSALNYNFLLSLEADHLSRGNALNGLAVYMRTIRAVFNFAIKKGVIDQELYPFKNYSIKTTKTRKRAINITAIKKIEDLKLTQDHELYHTRNYFLFCYYTRGLPFADMAHLQVKDLIDGRIIYARQKTEQPLDIKITPKIATILNLYIQGKEKDKFIFDIIKRIDIADQYKDVEWSRHRYNKKLKKLAIICEIEQNLTSYVSRHSFATRAKNLKVPIMGISEMLGHDNIKTTQIYLDSLPSDDMDDYHNQIIED